MQEGYTDNSGASDEVTEIFEFSPLRNKTAAKKHCPRLCRVQYIKSPTEPPRSSPSPFQTSSFPKYYQEKNYKLSLFDLSTKPYKQFSPLLKTQSKCPHYNYSHKHPFKSSPEPTRSLLRPKDTSRPVHSESQQKTSRSPFLISPAKAHKKPNSSLFSRLKS